MATLALAILKPAQRDEADTTSFHGENATVLACLTTCLMTRASNSSGSTRSTVKPA